MVTIRFLGLFLRTWAVFFLGWFFWLVDTTALHFQVALMTAPRSIWLSQALGEDIEATNVDEGFLPSRGVREGHLGTFERHTEGQIC